jgi:ADP-ribose pyrophosphatase YjhB (NUDIX family)
MSATFTRAKGCPTWYFSLVVCQHPDGRYLAVEESRGRGWWLPGGFVDAGDILTRAAVRETQEEAGIDVRLAGVLQFQQSMNEVNARARAIFFARPVDPAQLPKSVADDESESARWCSVRDLERLALKSPGLRGKELLNWARYLDAGGLVYPMQLLSPENPGAPPPDECVPFTANAHVLHKEKSKRTKANAAEKKATKKKKEMTAC